MRASFHRRWATLRESPTGINQPTVEIRRRSPLSNFPGKVGAIVVALGGGWKCACYALPIAFHNFGRDWSIGLIPECRFHLTNSPISILDRTPKPLYFFLRKSRFSELGKKGKNWSIWGGRNLKNKLFLNGKTKVPGFFKAFGLQLGLKFCFSPYV